MCSHVPMVGTASGYDRNHFRIVKGSFMESHQFDDWEISVSSQRMSRKASARSYAEKLADGATKVSYRKSHRYGDRTAYSHDTPRGRRGK